MSKKNSKGALFWTSYSDLMTTLFFVMLVLFIVVTIAMGRIVQNNKVVIDELAHLRNLKDSIENLHDVIVANEQAVNKIKEIEKSIENIDHNWFEYKPQYKKHMLKIDVTFETGQSDITNIPLETREDLYQAGLAIERFLNKAEKEFGESVEYLLIIEGQASNDGYSRNFELSYERALALYKYLKHLHNRSLDLKRKNCEVLISGSGTQGTMRALPDNGSNKTNQRFLIHILPKPGIIQ